MSSFSGLHIASSGLFASQTALNVVSHNIANANTIGYTRQRLNLESSKPLSRPNVGMIGTGVTQKSITQVRDKFLDFKMRSELPGLGEWSTKADILKNIDAIFNEPSSTDSGIQSVMDEFYKSLEELTKTPDELTTRAMVRQKAIALTTSINTMASKLKKQQEDLDFEVKTTVQSINSYAKQISQLNEIIYKQEADGITMANDMRDKRNVLLDEMSKLAKINYFEGNNGEFTVVLEDRPIVSHYDSYELKAIKREDKLNYTDNSGLYEVVWADTENKANVIGTTDLNFNKLNSPVGSFDFDFYGKSSFTLSNLKTGDTEAIVLSKIKDQIAKEPPDGYGIKDDIDVSIIGDKLKLFNNTTGKTIDTDTMPPIAFDATGALVADVSDTTFTIDRKIPIELTMTKGMSDADLLTMLQGQIETQLGKEMVFDTADVSITDGKLKIKNSISDATMNTDMVPDIKMGLENDVDEKIKINGSDIDIELKVAMTKEEIRAHIQGKVDAAAIGNPNLANIEVNISDRNISFATKGVGIDEEIKIVAVPASTLGFTTGVVKGSNADKLEATSGVIKGLIAMRDNISGNSKGIPYYMNMLNNFTDTLTSEMNTIHKGGFGLDKSTGVDFFTTNGMTTKEYDEFLENTGEEVTSIPKWDASKTDEENEKIIDDAIKAELAAKGNEYGKTIKKLTDGSYYYVDKMDATMVSISGDLEDDDGLNKIAASSLEGELPGNNLNAHKLSGTKQDDTLFDWGNPDDFIKSLISNLGVDGQEAIRMTNNQIVVVNQIDKNRQSVSGVSLDEEMTNMVKFQHAFNASARMITVVDEMLDKVINGLGVVGR